MGKISYSNLKLQVKNDVKTFIFNDNEIEVKQYLPISKKNDLVYITLQKATSESTYNPIELDMFFHLNIIYLYTNLNITEKQREDEWKLYDILYSNNIIQQVLELIPEEEYKMLYEYLNEVKKDNMFFKTSAAGMLQTLIQELPKQAQISADLMKNFDMSNFKEVIDFAKAANNGKID